MLKASRTIAELYVRLGKTRKLYAAGQATDADLARIEAEVAEARRVLGPVIAKKRKAWRDNGSE